MGLVFVDTSAVYALYDRSDGNHEAARTRLLAMSRAHSEPVLSNFVVAECHGLLLGRLGAEVARRWLDGNVWRVERVLERDEERAAEIIRQQIDKSYSYVDATSFAVMERLRISRVLAFDRHFAQFGFDVL